MDKLTTLSSKLGEHLLQKHLRLATAESCTGGGLGYVLTEIPGSSNWFERGFITYSNDAKISLLNVKQETLNQFGAVSEQTAREMAEGALKNSQAQISVSITGIAGPDGGTSDKPVGTVWWAIARKDHPTIATVDIFKGNRTEIRLAVIQRVMEHLLTHLT